MPNAAVGKNRIIEKDGMVTMPVKEYRRLLERSAPVCYLKGKAAERLDKLVEEGLKEHREGKTISAPSLKEALKIYDRKRSEC